VRLTLPCFYSGTCLTHSDCTVVIQVWTRTSCLWRWLKRKFVCCVFDVLTVLLWVTRTYTARNTLTRNRWFKALTEKSLLHRRNEPLIYGVFFRSTHDLCLVVRVYVLPSVFCVSVQSYNIAKNIVKYLKQTCNKVFPCRRSEIPYNRREQNHLQLR
jgi:hypothetical protein